MPSLPGSVKTTEPVNTSGAFSDTPLVESLSVKVSLLAVLLSPLIVTLLATVAAPVISMVVAPVMNDGPLMVPAVISGLISVLFVSESVVLRPTKVSSLVGRIKVPVLEIVLIAGLMMVLLVRVSVAVRVTTTPDVGNTAVELTPVPPSPVGKIPVTAADCDKSTAPKLGAPPPLGTVKL